MENQGPPLPAFWFDQWRTVATCSKCGTPGGKPADRAFHERECWGIDLSTNRALTVRVHRVECRSCEGSGNAPRVCRCAARWHAGLAWEALCSCEDSSCETCGGRGTVLCDEPECEECEEMKESLAFAIMRVARGGA
jgi:hypothetical protein